MDNTEHTEKQMKIRNAIMYLMFKEPLLSYFLNYTQIKFKNIETASTDGINIYISPNFISKLDIKDVAFVLSHEALHIILRHVPRIKALVRRLNINPYIANVAADAIINTALKHIATSALPAIYCDDLPQHLHELCYRGAFEEIVYELIKNKYKVNVDIIEDLDTENYNEQESGDEKSTDGHCNLPRGNLPHGKDEKGKTAYGGKSDEEIEREIIERVLRSYAFAKSAGNVSAGIERVISELLKPQVDWRSLLRKYLANQSVKRTWSRLSRKLPGVYPGKTLYGKPRIIVLIDTSASIGERELIQFMTELKNITGHAAKVVVIFWDADVEAVYELRHPGDVKKITPKGGGGTMIHPALSLVDKQYKDFNYIVILSDWEIGDLNDEDVIALLRKYSDRIIAVTTFAAPPQFIKKTVKINIT
ncbi:MAG: VWA-like domain-containing protein [Pyrobaculum sp.]